MPVPVGVGLIAMIKLRHIINKNREDELKTAKNWQVSYH